MMTERVVVFLDWQNVYMRAREAFHEYADRSFHGQVKPLELAELLASKGTSDSDRVLTEVRIYRGMPDQAFDARGYAAARRQNAAWQMNNRVRVFPRALRYPSGWSPGWSGSSPREKGVDVALALDFVTCGIDGDYDTGIVMSADQDLVPALEYIDRRRIRTGAPRLEVAAWRGDYGRRPNRIALPHSKKPYCHWLTEDDYRAVQDVRDYTVKENPPATGGIPIPAPPGRWL